MNDLKKYIRSIPDFPRAGITFYDITTLFQQPAGLKATLDQMESYIRSRNAQKIVGIESRGFVLGGALADRMDLPFVLARKPGKLPFESISEKYDLEYGSDSLELHVDAVRPGDRVVIVDDLIATGGTLLAACRLVEKLGGEVTGISSAIALTFLPFAELLTGYDVNFLVSYDSE